MASRCLSVATSSLVAFFAVVGFLTTAVATIAFAYYVATRRPTPDATVREALTSIRWTHAAGLFILPPTIAGALEGDPLFGFALGAVFVAFVLVLQWWFGPV